jgi:hypothetical protein
VFTDNNENGNQDTTILQLLKSSSHVENNKESEEEGPERFNSVINFSNFLLHILRVLVNQSDKYNDFDKNIPLDDKRLLDTFDQFLSLEGERKKTFVEDFAFLLLKGKHYYDKYIIKRNLKNEKWSLKYLKVVKYDHKASHQYINSLDENGGNKSILMLLSMFHVSSPTLIYKHWLNASLNYVLNQEKVSSDAYVNYLENLSDAFLYDRFLAKDEADYYDIIYNNTGKVQNDSEQIILSKLNNGTQVENFIFNRLDYILWKKDQAKEKKEYSDFLFSFRTSVEHYYPQNPIEGNEKLEQPLLDKFGNLCLISRSKNSKLSNYMPTAKKDHYVRKESIESIKQQIMMTKAVWGKDEILENTKEMTNTLIQKTT